MRELQFVHSKPTFYDFEPEKVIITGSNRVVSFGLKVDGKTVMTVTDTNANTEGINTLIVDTDLPVRQIQRPNVMKAVAKVRRDYVASQYTNKEASYVNELLTKGYIGATHIVAELALLAIQCQVAFEVAQQVTTDKQTTIYYLHIGNNRLFFNETILNSNTYYRIGLGQSTPAAPKEFKQVVAETMQIAQSAGQYLAGVVALPVGHDWYHNMNLEKLLGIYL